MKRVRSLTAEPLPLANYRANNPGEEKRPATEAKSVWSGFKSDQAAYRQVLDDLVRTQQGLCLYCEQLLVDQCGGPIFGDYQIEHVLAKSGATGRALDWANLVLACTGGTYPHHQDALRFMPGPNQSCGQTKDDADLPPGTDPRSIPLAGSIVDVDMVGKLEANAANCTASGVSVRDVARVIALLNLNCERLRKARQNQRDNINSWFVPLLTELLAATHLNAAERQQMLDLWIAGRLRPNPQGNLRAFWSTERLAIGEAAEMWISNNQGLFQ